MAAADRMEAAQGEVRAAANRLSCGTQVLLLLVRFKYEMEQADLDVLQQYLSPSVNDDAEQGWEECTDAALVYLLRTLLAKNARDAGGAAAAIAMPKDTSKLKKHLLAVFEKLPKSRLAAVAGGGATATT